MSEAPSNAPLTVVLVHGAFADSSSWDGVIERLQAAGLQVTAAPNPLRGISHDSAYVASFIKQVRGGQGFLVVAEAVADNRARVRTDGHSDPSPRAPASRSVVSIRAVVSRGVPRHAERISAPYGAERIPVASSTDAVSETVVAATAKSPQNTSTGVRALRASASSLSVPVSRAISTLEPDSDDACSSSQISSATTHPWHSQRSRSLADAFSPESRLTASSAEWNGHLVIVREGDQRVQQQVGGRGLGVGRALRGPGGIGDLGNPDAPVEPGPEQRRGERVHVRLPRDGDVQRLEPAGGGQKERVASVPRLETNASCARSRSIRARWSSSSGPASAVASRPRAVVNAPA